MHSTPVSSMVHAFAVPDAAAIVGNGRLCRYSMMPSSRHSSALLGSLEPLQACMQRRCISKMPLLGSCWRVCIAAIAALWRRHGKDVRWCGPTFAMVFMHVAGLAG